ncbi:hypothetical protein BKA65DRAFT_217472 [Rhexocercosporidium sp. MPI-PUGE-AT-0058]|nr:hypothetical protein BKA65DRAFT_217472 [Rhexocercosporidium sp. MPI-PUGE-AT-0058]
MEMGWDGMRWLNGLVSSRLLTFFLWVFENLSIILSCRQPTGASRKAALGFEAMIRDGLHVHVHGIRRGEASERMRRPAQSCPSPLLSSYLISKRTGRCRQSQRAQARSLLVLDFKTLVRGWTNYLVDKSPSGEYGTIVVRLFGYWLESMKLYSHVYLLYCTKGLGTRYRTVISVRS